ncbi:MAG TPA: LuxR C-terminal-related transcriptional regulator, partial [bacterium]|nr:LuxR C-terminal-related transcriptional regulator [bacterium]
AKKSPMAVPPASVEISRKNGESVHANLRLVRNRNGEYFIAVELESSEVSPQLLEIAANYQLTKTETQVLQCLSLGLSDREISRRLFISLATVHTHVKHILAKLEVSSRLQAALVAHGRKFKETE